MLDVFGPSANAVLAISKMSEDSHPKYNLKQSQKNPNMSLQPKGQKLFLIETDLKESLGMFYG